ncbi:hypothetical protein [Undibacterium sp. TJN19]|uniref:COG3904 family protein n=1 Tax=Undibacterium sp. TJN19 TaxID=3413055 RepID=UPI003BEF8A73
MITGIRVINFFSMVVFVLYFLLMIFRQSGHIPEQVGMLVASGLWMACLFFPWRALGPDGTMKSIKSAWRWTVAGLVVITLACLANMLTQAQKLELIMGMIIVSLPFGLNALGLYYRQQILDDDVAERIEPGGSITLPGQPSGHASDFELPLHDDESIAAPAVTHPSNTTATAHYAHFEDEDLQDNSNYLLKHWRGNLPLGLAFWGNGILIGNVLVSAIMAGIKQMTEMSGSSLPVLSMVSLLTLVLTMLVWCWSFTGIWRSARKHARRGGSSGAAVVAQLIVALNVVYMASNIVNSIAPQMREYFLIATGNDDMKIIEISHSPKGDSLYLKGILGTGSADKFAAELAQTSQVRFIVLNSGGGRLLEAERIADLVRQRRLDTYVEGLCASACTYVFLAGKDRAATVNAKIGFHQPSFPGMDADAVKGVTKTMLDKYRGAGLPEAFLQRVGNTRAEDMWFPTREELIAANVVTRTSLGGEANVSVFSTMTSKAEMDLAFRSAAIWRAYDARFPGLVNELSETIWQMKLKGANDLAMSNAARLRLAKSYNDLLKTLDDSLLDEFADITVAQMQAAKKISPEACAKFLRTELDVRNTLPAALMEKEKNLTMRALVAPARTKVINMDSKEFKKSMIPLTARMLPLHLKVISQFQQYAGQPELQCDAMISFYQNISSLPANDRHVVLAAIMQEN